MKQKPSSRRRRSSTKSVLCLPDLEHAKAAVLNSLNSADAKRGYRHAIAAATGDHDSFVVERIVDVRQSSVGTWRRLVDLHGTLHVQSFVGTLVVKDFDELIECSLLRVQLVELAL